jgi:RNA polymerase subunit RPABC4/transcription elongation factor Spt4
MRRCNHCFRYATGQPLYCPTCGRSYDARICPRGHINPRTTQFCPTCGSSEFSTPAPPETFLAWTSRWVLQLFVGTAVGLFIIAAVGSIVVRIDWHQLTQPFVSLVLMIGALYWLTTLLPGPIKKVGRAAGRQVAKALKGSTKRH